MVYVCSRTLTRRAGVSVSSTALGRAQRRVDDQHATRTNLHGVVSICPLFWLVWGVDTPSKRTNVSPLGRSAKGLTAAAAVVLDIVRSIVLYCLGKECRVYDLIRSSSLSVPRLRAYCSKKQKEESQRLWLCPTAAVAHVVADWRTSLHTAREDSGNLSAHNDNNNKRH